MTSTRKIGTGIAAVIFIVRMHAAQAVTFEPMGKAIGSTLGTTANVTKKTFGKDRTEVYSR